MAGPAPHVLFLTESFHPVLGGGESHVRSLSTRLVEAGWSATVVTRRTRADWPARETLDGVGVVRVPPSGPARTGKYLMVPAATRAALRGDAAYDLLVVRGTRVLGLPGLLAGRARLRPVVLQPEINGELSGEAFLWGRALARSRWSHAIRLAVAARNRFFKDADACVAMSRAIEAEMLGAGLERERVVYLPHGIDTARFRPATADEKAALRRELGLPPAAPVVVWTGRLLKGKGLETLLEAFATIAARDPDPVLLLVGSGEGQALSIEAELRTRASAPPLGGRVVFAGRVDDVAPYLRAADLFAFPSEFEALGLSLLEAGGCGLASVAARTGGIVDVIEDEANGLLFEPRDAVGLADRLQRLLADEGLRAALGRGARLIVAERFDEAASAERYRALFAELLARRRG